MKKSCSLLLLLLTTTLFGNLNAQHTYESADFTINFPGEEIKKMSEVVPTDIGDIEITYHIFEKSPEEVYMVSENQYNKDSIAGLDPWMLIEGGRDGALNSFGIPETDSEEKSEIDGFPALEFKASNEKTFVVYKIILVDNTLFQLLILSSEKYPKKSVVKDFIDSFELHIE